MDCWRCRKRYDRKETRIKILVSIFFTCVNLSGNMLFHLLCQHVLSLDYKQHAFVNQILDTNQRSVTSDIVGNKFFRIDTKLLMHGFKDLVVCCVILDDKVFTDNGIKEVYGISMLRLFVMNSCIKN